MQTIPVAIGTLVDFIVDNTRQRGVVHGAEDGMLFIPVIGNGITYTVHRNNVVPVKHHDDFVNFLRAK